MDNLYLIQVNLYQAKNVSVVAEIDIVDRLRECPAQGKSCNKCGRLHHFESVCGMIPSRRSQSRPSGKAVNELHQNQNNSLTSFPRYSEHNNSVNTVPKQVLDVVNLANSGMNSGKNLQHHLELNTLFTSTCQSQEPVKSQPMQMFFQHRN